MIDWCDLPICDTDFVGVDGPGGNKFSAQIHWLMPSPNGGKSTDGHRFVVAQEERCSSWISRDQACMSTNSKLP